MGTDGTRPGNTRPPPTTGGLSYACHGVVNGFPCTGQTAICLPTFALGCCSCNQDSIIRFLGTGESQGGTNDNYITFSIPWMVELFAPIKTGATYDAVFPAKNYSASFPFLADESSLVSGSIVQSFEGGRKRCRSSHGGRVSAGQRRRRRK